MGNCNLNLKQIKKAHTVWSFVHASQYCVPVGDQSQNSDKTFWHVQMFYWFRMWACLSLPVWPFIWTSIILYFSAFFCPFFPSLSVFTLRLQTCVSLSPWRCQKKKKVAVARGRYCNSLKHWALLMHFPASKRQQRRGLSRRSEKQHIKQAGRARVRPCQGSEEGRGFTKP